LAIIATNVVTIVGIASYTSTDAKFIVQIKEKNDFMQNTRE